MEKFTFANVKVEKLFVERKSLTADFIKEEGLTKEFVAQYNATLKTAKKADKLAAFKASYCTVTYKERTCKINPCFTTTENGQKIVLFRNIDANSYVVCFGKLDKVTNKETVAIKVVTRASDKSQNIEVKKTLVKNNTSFLKNLLSDVTSSFTFEEFCNILSVYKNKKDIECPKVLRSEKF